MTPGTCTEHPDRPAEILYHYGKNRCRECLERWVAELEQRKQTEGKKA